MTVQFLAALLAGCICAAAAQVLLKLGAVGRSDLVEFLNLYVLAGLSLYVLGASLWVFVLSRVQLVTVFPFTLLTFVLVIAAGALLLDERITMIALAGMALVMIGVALIAIGSNAS